MSPLERDPGPVVAGAGAHHDELGSARVRAAGEGERSRGRPEVPQGRPDPAGVRDAERRGRDPSDGDVDERGDGGFAEDHVAQVERDAAEGAQGDVGERAVSHRFLALGQQGDREDGLAERTGSSRRRSRDPSRRRSSRPAGTSDPRPPGRTARRPRPPRPHRRGRATRRPPTGRTTRPSTSARGLANRRGSARTRRPAPRTSPARRACPRRGTGPGPSRSAPPGSPPAAGPPTPPVRRRAGRTMHPRSHGPRSPVRTFGAWHRGRRTPRRRSAPPGRGARPGAAASSRGPRLPRHPEGDGPQEREQDELDRADPLVREVDADAPGLHGRRDRPAVARRTARARSPPFSTRQPPSNCWATTTCPARRRSPCRSRRRPRARARSRRAMPRSAAGSGRDRAPARWTTRTRSAGRPRCGRS